MYGRHLPRPFFSLISVVGFCLWLPLFFWQFYYASVLIVLNYGITEVILWSRIIAIECTVSPLMNELTILCRYSFEIVLFFLILIIGPINILNFAFIRN